MLKLKREVRKKRIRGRIAGSALVPRFTVFRSNKFIYAQLINDAKGVTLAEARGEDAKAVGEQIAQKAKKARIRAVVFDRSGYKFHGKVEKLAQAAREGGLKF
jgi:large subunit ribosomal protein L18